LKIEPRMDPVFQKR